MIFFFFFFLKRLDRGTCNNEGFIVPKAKREEKTGKETLNRSGNEISLEKISPGRVSNPRPRDLETSVITTGPP